MLRAMAKSVAAAGVKRVAGDLVLDDTAFTGPMRHPGWEWNDGEWNWFKAPVSSITLTDACLELTVLPGASVDSPAVLRMDPATQVVKLVNRVVTAPATPKKTIVNLGRSDGAGTIPVTGTVPAGSAGFLTESACVDPVAYFGDVFLRVLREEGVAVAGRPVVRRVPDGAAEVRNVSADPSQFVPLARHATTVLDTVRIANKHSQNLYAELLLRALGHAAGDGSFEGGCAVTRAAFGFARTDASFVQVDGSGLARDNQITVGAMGKVLVKMYGSPVATDFIASLPGPGEPDSTLRDRFKAAKYDRRIFAKTGTLRDTKALAGYVRSESGRTFAFVVFCEGDNGKARDLQDDIVDVLVDQ
jgi:D-alanyl-D-alanine carboxypeptidase/D-alanyl-D-alanine-endopeptidase (penicillin-binding protein 4)